ncbi:hypothetical protein EVAR_30380_1 [Eumeta japonica]|uniref:Uncharacterized protein n=1 Tax=Eumeta variegata TaxID=151549 RepID=A0A4C1W5A7_EUMVA|nr:hypothetical protein EVAR_30380_1 [Eumeta japonica]
MFIPSEEAQTIEPGDVAHDSGQSPANDPRNAPGTRRGTPRALGAGAAGQRRKTLKHGAITRLQFRIVSRRFAFDSRQARSETPAGRCERKKIEVAFRRNTKLCR